LAVFAREVAALAQDRQDRQHRRGGGLDRAPPWK